MSLTMPKLNEMSAGDLPEQIRVGDKPDAGRFTEANNGDRLPWRLKPHGGMWTSSRNEDRATGWVAWCRAEDFGSVDAADWWIVVPRPDARLLVIDNADDLLAIAEAFPLEPPWRGLVQTRLVDFDAVIAAGYDGLRLTEKGHWDTRYDGPYGITTYSWDCESTVWFRWCFDHVEQTDRAPAAPQRDGKAD